MNFKQLNEKSKKIIQQSSNKKSVDLKKNNTVVHTAKSNIASKNSVEKKLNKEPSPDVKSSVVIKTEQSQTKETVISPKHTTSNYINFTKRSINIKQVQTNQSEVSKESNIVHNNSVQRNLEPGLKGIASTDKNKTNFSKITATVINPGSNKPNHTFATKDSKKTIEKQLLFLKSNNKETKHLLETNKTIDLTGSIKVSNVITTPQNKQMTLKENFSTNNDYKSNSSKPNETKAGSIAISVKTGDTIATCTDTDIMTKKASSNVSSINSKKTTIESAKTSFNLINNLKNTNKTVSNTSKEKSNEKKQTVVKNIPNQSSQLAPSKSKNNIKNVKIDIHKKEINLVSSSVEKNKSVEKNNSNSRTTKQQAPTANLTHVNFTTKNIKSLNNSNIAPIKGTPQQVDKKQLAQIASKMANNSRNVETSRSIIPFSPKEETKEISNRSIVDKFYDKLSLYEKEEIKSVKEVYFLGRSIENESSSINLEDNTRKSNGGSMTPLNNIENKSKTFDDENGNYIIKKGEHINYRYEVISELGKGSFGQAFKCLDHKSKNYCCVKIIRSEEKFTNQAKIEIRILEFIQSHDTHGQSNIVKILDHFMFRAHVCIVFELLEMNLYELIKSHNFSGLEPNFVRSIANQLLNCINFLQANNIIHCDLKPENILLTEWNKNIIKVIDFGSSCFDNEKLYAYIQSRYYRAPEVILGLGYNPQIDMWSFGCVLAELFTGIPIFPGENEFDQLNYMMEYLGVPPENIILSAKKKDQFFDEDLVPIKKENSKGKIRLPNTKRFEDFLEGAEDDLLDLIKRCLVWNPFKRIKPEDALKHRYFTNQMRKSFTNKLKSSHKFINVVDNKKSNYLKYKVQINKMVSNKYQHNNSKPTKLNSNFSKDDSHTNFTK